MFSVMPLSLADLISAGNEIDAARCLQNGPSTPVTAKKDPNAFALIIDTLFRRPNVGQIVESESGNTPDPVQVKDVKNLTTESEDWAERPPLRAAAEA